MSQEKRGYPFLIVLAAVAVVFGMSFVPWSKVTGNFCKDFDLLADLHPDRVSVEAAGGEIIDPDLAAVLDSIAADTVAEVVEEQVDTIVAAKPRKVLPTKARVDGEMVIEDYTETGEGLAQLRRALKNATWRPARIAVIGDSYIEGDIFTQDIRRELQDRFGGRGVGYMAAHSNVAGFRQSVKHSDTGWAEHDSRKGGSKYFPLSAEYYTASEVPATITYKGAKRGGHTAAWNKSQMLFVAPVAGKIKLQTDSVSQEFDIEPSAEVQMVEIADETTSLTITTTIPGLVNLGTWLTDGTGVVVDCMSVRGDSGITHRYMSADLAGEMSQYVDYDLIIVEYGINALTSEQTEYNGYSKLMTQVIARLREAYPNADILLLGIGDRGQKVNGEVHSLPTAAAMVDAQRRAAMKAGCLFWDTREAMGGEDAIVQWRGDKLVNADYIHLNSQGGARLAKELVNSIIRNTGE